MPPPLSAAPTPRAPGRVPCMPCTHRASAAPQKFVCGAAVQGRRTGGLLHLVTGGGCVGDVTVQLAGMLDLLTIGGGNCIAGFGWLTFFFICFGLMSSSSCAMPIRLQGKPIRRHTPQAHTIITGRMKETGF